MVAVVHINHSGKGGAGRAARRAHLSCLAAGLNSQLLVASDADETAGDVLIKGRSQSEADAARAAAWQDVQWGYLPDAGVMPGSSLFTVEYPGLRVSEHPLVARADIVHLHWISWFVSPTEIGRILEAGKQIFWTLHDMAAFTGGCHYSHGCEKYLTACARCPLLRDSYQLAEAAFHDKAAGYGGEPRPGLTIITPSEWLAQEAKKSSILAQQRVRVVRNSVETDIFSPPRSRASLRQAFGFGPNDTVFTFGNFDNSERRKGGALIDDALQQLPGFLEKFEVPSSNVHLMVFGRGSLSADQINGGVNVVDLGELSDDRHMADLLGVSDFAVFPSLEDNYPNTLVEARACGTPSIGFNIGGVPEIVRDGETGVIVNEQTSRGLALAMADAAKVGGKKFRKRCRDAAVAENGIAAVGTILRETYGCAEGKEAKRSSQANFDRAANLLGRISSRIDSAPSVSYSNFPVKPFLNSRVRQPEGDAPLAMEYAPVNDAAAQSKSVSRAVRVAVLVGYHWHHSEFSGPVQFLKHLDPRQVEVKMYRMPMGHELAGSRSYDAQSFLRSELGTALQGNSISLDLELLQDCLRGDVDVVHAVDAELMGGMFLALKPYFPELARVKTIGSLHQPPEILEPMLPVATGKYDRLVSLCATQTSFLAQKYGPAKLVQIPHGIDIDFFSPEPVGGASTDGPHLASVGHWLRDYKTAIEAAAIVRKTIPDLRYVIVCHNFPTDVELPSWVELRSGLTDEELVDLYRSVKIFYQPLQDATANNAILEAMSVGTPVVSTDVGGVSEMVLGGCGLLAPPEDAEALADNVLTLLNDADLLVQYGENARRRVEELDWRKIASQFTSLYEELAR